jgi:hypothetical protein
MDSHRQHWARQQQRFRQALSIKEQLLAGGALAEAAYALAQAWGGWRKSGLLAMPATRHNFTHLNEARRIRQKLR